jgi:cytochrome c-type biogenesis protein CcmF
VSSVHAFAQSSIGDWFLAFLGIIFAACLFFFIKNRSHLKSENRLESLVSRESSFLFNNVLLLVSCFAVLWGTLFPILSEWVEGHKVTVGPPFFNRVNVPIAILLLLLTAVGPLLAWRKTSVDSLKRNLGFPSLIALCCAIGLAYGIRPWQDVARFYSLMAISLSVLVFATVVSEFMRGARVLRTQTGQNLFLSTLLLTRRNTRRYGGYIVHLGVIIVAIGLAGAAFNQEQEQEMGNGDKMQIAGYTLVCRSYTEDDNPNYESEWAIIDVFKNGRQIDTLYPERRFYKASQQASTIVANRSTMKEDLYLVYSGRNTDTQRPIIKAHVNPLVGWIWAGVLAMVFGTLIALTPSAVPVRVVGTANAPTPAHIAVEARVPGAGD